MQPFTPLDKVLSGEQLKEVTRASLVAAESVARCTECFAVINRFSQRLYRRCVGRRGRRARGDYGGAGAHLLA